MKVLVLSVDSFPVVAELLVFLDADIPGAADGDGLLPRWTKASMALAQFPMGRDTGVVRLQAPLPPTGSLSCPPILCCCM